jgi:hypothetical protein
MDDKENPQHRWDAFVSHASEDKAEIVLPLTNELRKFGLRVWLDKFELRVGDSLREKIDEGLAESRFGVVILSPAFFSKKWPKKELNGLFAKEVGGVGAPCFRRAVLDYWITKSEPTLFSPLCGQKQSET